MWHSAWRAFRTRFIQADGRVIDYGDDARATSEGQAYAMFHALVADDRQTFELLRRWTRDNLCEGDFDKRLAAWKWGRHSSSGIWGVLDQNNAADADLMIAWSLLEAAARWNEPRWQADARAIADALEAACLRTLPGIGPVLLPGRQGFERGRRTRLNPSYVMVPVLRRLAAEWPAGAWGGLRDAAIRLLSWAAQPHRLARDWVEYDAATPAMPVGDARGGYDAIRVYFWAAMANDAGLVDAYRGMAELVRSHSVPEYVNAADGSASGSAPVGFAAALLPYVAALRYRDVHDRLRQQIERQLVSDPEFRHTSYYDANLMLFGLGASTSERSGLYRFGERGELKSVDR